MPVPAQYAIFPVINAPLNRASTILLLTGRWLISRRIAQHRLVMLTAFVTSTLFLISYLYHHFHVGSVPFQGTGWTRRPVYFSILISHVLLAIAIVPLVIVALTRASRPFRQASCQRPLDIPTLAVCFRHGRPRLLYAVPLVRIAFLIFGFLRVSVSPW